jgi:hypothetical protein
MYRFDLSAESRFQAVFFWTGSRHRAGLAFLLMTRSGHHRSFVAVGSTLRTALVATALRERAYPLRGLGAVDKQHAQMVAGRREKR